MLSTSKSTGNSYITSYTERAYHETNVDEIPDELATTWTKKSKHLKGDSFLELNDLLQKSLKAALLYSFDIYDNWRNAIKVVKAGIVYSHAGMCAEVPEEDNQDAKQPENHQMALNSQGLPELGEDKAFFLKN